MWWSQRLRDRLDAVGVLKRLSRIKPTTFMRLSRMNSYVMRFDRVTYAVTMGRWEPNARERLETAALDLFVENGYEETTVTQIAERAGMNRATFFRHFADKREVLFGGEDVLAGLFADAITAAPSGAALTDCLWSALAAAEVVMTTKLRTAASRRILVVARSSELQERGLLKHARIATSVTASLRERGEDELTARLGAEIVLLAFNIAFERWMRAKSCEPFSPFAQAALYDLQVRTAELSHA